MEEKAKPYLESNRKTKKVLIIAGSIVLGIGLLLTFIGLIGFVFSPFGNGFFFAPMIPMIVGVFLDFVGGALLMFGLIGPASRYLASQAAPVQKDAANYLLDGTRDETAKTVAAVTKSLKEGLVEDGGQKCPHCGFLETKDATFCSKCGKPLGRVCPECGKKNEADASFCSSCGHHFE